MPRFPQDKLNVRRPLLSKECMRALAFIAFASSAVAADSALPEPFTRDRYEQTRNNSPFVLATKSVAEVVAPQTKFTENMVVVGLGRADGREYVAIVRRGEERAPIRLWGNSPNGDGISIQQIEWSDTFGKSKVKLRKDGLVEKIGFDENAAKGTGAAPPINVGKPPVIPGVKTAPPTGRVRVRNIQ